MIGRRFVSGVASGDPTTTSLVLWARVDGPPAPVTWTLAGAGGTEEATGSTRSDDRGVVRVEVDGLRPDGAYEYWFDLDDRVGEGDTGGGDNGGGDNGRGDNDRSPVGRTRTLPARPSAVRLGIVCCARWPSGEFTGYRSLTDRDVDLVVHLGDYIYEDGDGGARGDHDPPHECVTLDDYDRRYTQYRGDAGLQALHALLRGWRRPTTTRSTTACPGSIRTADRPPREWTPNGVAPGSKRMRDGCRSAPTATAPRPATDT